MFRETLAKIKLISYTGFRFTAFHNEAKEYDNAYRKCVMLIGKWSPVTILLRVPCQRQ